MDQKTAMNMWTELQASALDALGIPRYQHNQTLAKAAGELPLAPEPVADEVATVEPPQPVLYLLGPWLLQFPQALPVNYYPWLKDLSQFIESRPTQVSAAGNKTIIDCAFVAKDILSPAEKRALWQQLKPFLNQ